MIISQERRNIDFLNGCIAQKAPLSPQPYKIKTRRARKQANGRVGVWDWGKSMALRTASKRPGGFEGVIVGNHQRRLRPRHHLTLTTGPARYRLGEEGETKKRNNFEEIEPCRRPIVTWVWGIISLCGKSKWSKKWYDPRGRTNLKPHHSRFQSNADTRWWRAGRWRN